MDQTELSWPPVASEPPAPIVAPPASPFGEKRSRRSLRGRIGSALAGVGALIAKFAAQLKALLLLAPKAKLLLTAGSALVSVAAYSLFWGWEFAIGFVILLFIHEMGHVIQLRREGIRASAPTFVPFLGAVIAARSLGDDAYAEAKVGLAGPVLGTLGAAGCLAIGEITGSGLFMALAYIGFLVNLFNLIPVVPLDGGRAMAAMAPWLWFLGFGVIVTGAIALHNPFLVLIAFLAAFEPVPAVAAPPLGNAAERRLLPGAAAGEASDRRPLHRPDRAAGDRHERLLRRPRDPLRSRAAGSVQQHLEREHRHADARPHAAAEHELQRSLFGPQPGKELQGDEDGDRAPQRSVYRGL